MTARTKTYAEEELQQAIVRARRTLAEVDTDRVHDGQVQPPAWWAGWLAGELRGLIRAVEAVRSR